MSRRNKRGKGKPRKQSLPAMPNNSNNLQSSTSQFGIKIEKYQGILPHPDIMAGFQRILPDAPDRILKMAESQEEHRHFLEKSIVIGNVSAQSRGQWFGLAIALTGIVSGTVILLYGKSAEGLAVIFTPLTYLTGAFIYGKRKDAKELRDRLKNVPDSAKK